MAGKAIRTLRAIADSRKRDALFLQVHMLDVFDGVPEEALTQTPEFLHRVGGEELEAGQRSPLLMNSRRGGQKLLQMAGHGARGRFGGVHNADMRRRDAMQQRLQQRIVCAAENQRVRVVEAVGKGLTQVNASDLFRDRVFDPSLLNQRHQQRASLLPCVETARLKCFAVSMAAHRGLGPDDNNLLVPADRSGCLGPRFYDAYNRYMGCVRDAVQS